MQTCPHFPVGGGIPMLCGMSVVVGAYTLPQYVCKVQPIITKYFGFPRASTLGMFLNGPESKYGLPDLSGTAMAGTFACGQTEIVHDAAGFFDGL